MEKDYHMSRVQRHSSPSSKKNLSNPLLSLEPYDNITKSRPIREKEEQMTKYGYARTSTVEQVAGLADQVAKLKEAGCID
jgi:hypothetical protein